MSVDLRDVVVVVVAKSRPIRLTNTPCPKIGYDPTCIPCGLSRVCKDVRYGAISDSGRLSSYEEKIIIINQQLCVVWKR